MKSTIVTNKYINGGENKLIYYPISEVDFNNQLYEIFKDEYYRPRYPNNDVCIDIGANVGMATLYLNNFCKRIYSIEPSPKNYEALVNNVGDMENVKTFNHAIYTKNGDIALYGYKHEPEQTSHPGSYLNTAPELTSRIMVPCKTLGTFMEENKIDSIDVLKIDIEGSEYEIFCDKEFKETSKKINCIVGESHFTGEFSIPQLVEFLLKEAGFKFKFIKGKRLPNVWKEGKYINSEGVLEREFKFPFWTNFIAWKKR